MDYRKFKPQMTCDLLVRGKNAASSMQNVTGRSPTEKITFFPNSRDHLKQPSSWQLPECDKKT